MGRQKKWCNKYPSTPRCCTRTHKCFGAKPRNQETTHTLLQKNALAWIYSGREYLRTPVFITASITCFPKKKKKTEGKHFTRHISGQAAAVYLQPINRSRGRLGIHRAPARACSVRHWCVSWHVDGGFRCVAGSMYNAGPA